MFLFDAVPHTFKYVADRPVKRVNLAGDFNGWDKGRTPMTLSADGRTWTITVPIETGKHRYKFVIEGDQWILDPTAREKESDGDGHENSIVKVVPADFESPAVPGDGRVTVSALKHAVEPSFVNFDRGRLSISLRVRANDVRRVRLVVAGRSVTMTQSPQDELFARAQASIPWDGKSRLRYGFAIEDGGPTRYFTPTGLSTKAADFTIDPKTFPFITVPSWTEGTVLYQIFPDRFENGDRSNDPKDVVAWNTEPTYRNRFGGDIAGILKRLDYIKELGVGGIYFCPIFKSPVNHRYETTDYRQVDPQFGTNEEFAQLSAELRKAGIRTILDTVFNHSATNFFAFNDLVQNGADSPYRDWYWVQSFPIRIQNNPNYTAWFGFPSLPKLNVLNPATEKYLLATTDFWRVTFKPSGYRLDAADEVPSDFWRAFRKHVKAQDPDAWIVGERWGDATKWLGGDQWDSSMNYQFKDAVLAFCRPRDAQPPSATLNRLVANYQAYAPQVSRNMMNIVGSHDTARILNETGGRGELRDIAAVIQLTWPGTPCIYYGDEIGMDGGRDPQNRRGMRWDLVKSTNQTLALYRKLIAIRNSRPELRHGEPIALPCDDGRGILAFARAYQGLSTIIVINRSANAQDVSIDAASVPSGSVARVDRLGFAVVKRVGAKFSFRLEPFRAAILVPAGNQPSSSPLRSSGAMSSRYPENQ